MQKVNFVRAFFKALLLFILANLLWAIFTPNLGNASIYGHFVPGRPRFPFGEVPEKAYNFSLDNIDAMFESHEIESEYLNEEYSVFIVGDSSVWGTLLRPEETLAGQLNLRNLRDNETGLPIRFYNMGYPTLSLTKDVMVIEEALQPYDPDLIIWMVTLESMPWELQQRSPIVMNNPERLWELQDQYSLPIEKSGQKIEFDSFWERTLVGQRKEIADILRLQIYGFLWSATQIDQYYPDEYTPAAWDLEPDPGYYNFSENNFTDTDLAFELIQGAIEIANDGTETDFLIVNEPILISQGENADIRYNFYYPRWVYDQYRMMTAEKAVFYQWNYLDLWDLIPASEFTNSAIHLTPFGESLLADGIIEHMINQQNWSYEK